MKSITKLAFIAAVAAFGTGAAWADNDQHKNLLDIQRQVVEREQAATVALYAGGQSVQHQVIAESEPRTHAGVELQRDSHGGFKYTPALNSR